MGRIVDQDANAFLATLAPAPKKPIRQALDEWFWTRTTKSLI